MWSTTQKVDQSKLLSLPSRGGKYMSLFLYLTVLIATNLLSIVLVTKTVKARAIADTQREYEERIQAYEKYVADNA